MNPGKPLLLGNANEEAPALIETLHQTDELLEELTAGEVDAVVDRRGRTSLLRRAQDHLHDREAAILNTLPANIAVLDTQGRIILVTRRGGDFPVRMRFVVRDMGSASITTRFVMAHVAMTHSRPNGRPPAFDRCCMAQQRIFQWNIPVIRPRRSAGF